MAWLETDKQGFRIRCTLPSGERKTIRLTNISKTNVNKIFGHVGALEAAKRHGLGIEPTTLVWLQTIGKDLHDKLSGAGLIEPRVSALLGEFVAEYIERAEVAPGTKMNFRTVERNLVDFFGNDKALEQISRKDAQEFRKWLQDHEGQADNTMRRRCGRARQFFAAAMKAKLVSENPFTEMSVTVTGSTDRERFVTEAESQKILKACPDLQWRVIFTLCRYGGLRCPSEVLQLTWENVLWTEERIIVTSPKTKRYKGKESRVLPMFTELKAVLNEAYEAEFNRLENAGAGGVVSGKVITRYRSAEQNLRTTFEKIIVRAGLTPWPKPFQNLRSTRETELMETFGSHIVTSWIGHSEKVARVHYLQVTDENFRKAVSKKLGTTVPAESQGASQGAKRVEPTEMDGNSQSPEMQKAQEIPVLSSSFVNVQSEPSYPVGIGTRPQKAAKPAVSADPGGEPGGRTKTKGKQGGTDESAMLCLLFENWDLLHERTRVAILKAAGRDQFLKRVIEKEGGGQ